MATSRKRYLDILRLIAAFAVIVIHTSCRIFDNSLGVIPIDSLSWFFADMYDCLARFAVPVFLMISGALFFSRTVSIRKMWSKYILHVLLVFFFWSALFDVIANGDRRITGIAIWTLVGMSRFNFLLMMAALYAVYPILKKVTEDKKLLDYFLIINTAYMLVATTLLPNMSKYIGTWRLFPYVEALKTWVARFPLSLVSWTVLFFVMGFVIDQAQFSRRTRVLIYCGGILSTAFTIVMTYYDSIHEMTGSFGWMSYDTLNVFLQSTAIFTAARYAETKVPDKTGRIIEYLSKCTLGVYVMHTYVLDYLLPNSFHVDVRGWPTVIAIPCVSLLVYALCLVVSGLLRKIPGIRYFL